MRHYYWVAAEVKLGAMFLPGKAWVTHVFSFNKHLLTNKDIDEILYPRLKKWVDDNYRKSYGCEIKSITYLGAKTIS